MESGEIAENVVEAINGVVEYVSKKWEGVRSLHLKFSKSLALPAYQTVSDMKLKIQGISENVEGVEEEGMSEVELKEERKKDGKLGKNEKKKGRIHEVRYMDVSVGEDEVRSDVDGDEDENESKKIEDDDLIGSDKFVVKKRKKGGLAKEQALSKLNVEKPEKKSVKKGEGGRGKVNDENEGEKSENDDRGSVEIEVKKKKRKGDSTKGKVLSEKNVEKQQKKMSKKGDAKKQKKSQLAVKAMEESGGKKGKRKTGLGTAVKNSADKKVKNRKKSTE